MKLETAAKEGDKTLTLAEELKTEKVFFFSQFQEHLHRAPKVEGKFRVKDP